MKREIKVGMFFAIALFILATIIFIVGDFSTLFRGEGYPLYADFESAAGLERKTVVKMAGVKIGLVKEIRLKGFRAEVLFDIDKGIEVYKDSTAMLASLGLLGEKYIEIIPGKGPEICQPGDAIQSLTPVSFDQIGSLLMSVGEDISEVGKALKEMLGGEEPKMNFQQILQNLSVLTKDLKELTQENKGTLSAGIQSSNQTIQKFDQRVEAIANNLDELIGVMKGILEENRGNITDSTEKLIMVIEEAEAALKQLNEALGKVNRGEGTLGKLIQDLELYDRAEKTLSEVEKVTQQASSVRVRGGLHFDYYEKSDLFKGTLSLALWPTSDTYLLGQIVRDPWEERFTYSLLGGIRLGAFSPRAGILESELGIGLDLFAWQDRLRFSLESYNFNRDPRPRFRFATSFYATKFFYILFGLDDFSVSDNRELFFGLGVGI
jgi:phospholipid/cholesterol/gamma-HCH transport system substrate-binding protein